jgi:hypothetical protein
MSLNRGYSEGYLQNGLVCAACTTYRMSPDWAQCDAYSKGIVALDVVLNGAMHALRERGFSAISISYLAPDFLEILDAPNTVSEYCMLVSHETCILSAASTVTLLTLVNVS